MPEDKTSQTDAEQQPQPTTRRRRISPVLIAAVVMAIGAAVFAVVLLKGDKVYGGLTGKTQAPRHAPELLDIPTLEVADINVSVPVDSTAIQRRGLSVGVVVYFAPAEGSRLSSKELVKEFSPKVANLGAKFRSIVIKRLNSKDYNSLIKADEQEQLLLDFRNGFRTELDNYGLSRMAVVDQVVWKEFVWN
jgi:hypothetical protein